MPGGGSAAGHHDERRNGQPGGEQLQDAAHAAGAVREDGQDAGAHEDARPVVGHNERCHEDAAQPERHDAVELAPPERHRRGQSGHAEHRQRRRILERASGPPMPPIRSAYGGWRSTTAVIPAVAAAAATAAITVRSRVRPRGPSPWTAA